MPHTVSLSKWMDSCPLVSAAGELSYCVCRSFMKASRFTSAPLSPGCSEETCEKASEMSVSFLQSQGPVADTVATTPFMWLPKKYVKTASVTHAWQSVITGALYCVFTLKVVQVSICLSARQRCTHRQHIQAASLVSVSSALACFTEKEHFFFSLQQCRISSFPYAVSAVFSLPIVLKSPFIFKLAPSKVLEWRLLIGPFKDTAIIAVLERID